MYGETPSLGTRIDPPLRSSPPPELPPLPSSLSPPAATLGMTTLGYHSRDDSEARHSRVRGRMLPGPSHVQTLSPREGSSVGTVALSHVQTVPLGDNDRGKAPMVAKDEDEEAWSPRTQVWHVEFCRQMDKLRKSKRARRLAVAHVIPTPLRDPSMTDEE